MMVGPETVSVLFTGIELGIPCCTSLLAYKYCVCLSVCLSVDSALVV